MTEDRRISDIHLASYLRAKGYKIREVQPDGRRTEWVFADVPEKAILDYYNGVDQISARDLFNAFREMKGLSYQRI